MGTKLLEEVRMPKRCYVQLCDWRMPLSARICGKASFSAPRSCCQISLKLFMYYSVCISIEFFFVTATFYSSQQPYFTLKKKKVLLHPYFLLLYCLMGALVTSILLVTVLFFEYCNHISHSLSAVRTQLDFFKRVRACACVWEGGGSS